jgi:hypothetical protein
MKKNDGALPWQCGGIALTAAKNPAIVSLDFL